LFKDLDVKCNVVELDLVGEKGLNESQRAEKLLT
jgi:hypothetical protein